MKKARFILLVSVLALTFALCQQIAFADIIQNIPIDFQQIMYDDFGPASGSIVQLKDYNGGFGFLTADDIAAKLVAATNAGDTAAITKYSAATAGWKTTTALSTDLPYTTTPSQANPSFYINANGQLVTVGRDISMFRGLKDPIDMDTNAEYYLSFTVLSGNSSNTFAQQLKFRTIATDNIFGCGEAKSNNNPYGDITYPCLFGNSSGGNIVTAKTPGNNVTKVTIVMQISTRASSADIFKVRAFPANGVEQPSYTPSYWDSEIRSVGNAAKRYPDVASLFFGQNSGGAVTYTIDEIALYKGAPVSVLKTNAGAQSGFASDLFAFSTSGDTVTIQPVAATNANGISQTLVSQGWYDYTNPNSPTLISSDAAYVIPDGMIGKYLKAKVVVKDSANNETTYFPYARYITPKYVVERTYFTNGTTNSSSRLTSQAAGAAKTVGFYVEVRRTSTVVADRIDATKPMYILIAQYDVNNNLKQAKILTKSLYINPDNVTNAHVILPASTVNTGDYFKGFIWFGLDNVKPLTNNLNVGQPFIETRLN